MKDDLFSLYAFNRWASARVEAALRALSPEQYVQEPAPGWTSIRATLVHIAGATDIWSRRLQGQAVTARPTEAELPTLDDAVALLAKGHEAFDRLLPTLTLEQLESTWSYRDLKGTLNRLPLFAVYRHVVNHETYHRGQIASKLGRLGFEPPVTDFVYWGIEEVDSRQ